MKVRDKFAQWRSLSKWEARTFGLLAIPERIVAWALDRPSVVDWVKQPTAADPETLDRMAPEVRKAQIRDLRKIQESHSSNPNMPTADPEP